MQVVCGTCQLSFQAPDGATGLVCPICRSPLRAADAAAPSDTSTGHQMVEWAGGSLDDLISLLSGPAWSARIEVLPVNGGHPIGEVHVIAGGVSEAIFEAKSTHDALEKLRSARPTRFRIEPRLPNPTDGDLTFPGPDQGTLEERPLAQLMRYCETYVLTLGIEVWRGSENAKVEYRRGDIPADGVTVGGIDAPERLAEVMRWSSGRYRLIVPRLNLPATAPKSLPLPTSASRTPAAAAAAGASAVPATMAGGAATAKTIFGMPAVDPATLAAATEKIKSTPMQPPLKVPGATSPAGATSAPARNGSSAAPAGQPVAAAGGQKGAVPDSARANAAAAKTIIGVQPPGPTPPASSPASTALPAGAGTAPPPSATAAAPQPVAARGPASESGKVGRKGSAGADPAAAARAAQPTVPAISAATGAPGEVDRVDRVDRTLPTKTPKPKPNETPVWTYVGVGFIFGLVLLGVYRLVIVLAH